MLDPDDEKVIAECTAASATLITWDKVVRKAAGGMTPYEAMDLGLAAGRGTPEARERIAKMRKLSPAELTILQDGADKTWQEFRKYFKVDRPSAHLVKQLRCDEEYSWRAIARWASFAWGVPWNVPWGGNQIAGMVICEKAAKALGEDFMKEPWN